MVDSVSDVIRLARRQIQPVPASWTGPDAQCLIGIGVDDERRLILLDLEKLMLGKELESLEVEAC
jgi:purine-binding chemotaxis protein CheW